MKVKFNPSGTHIHKGFLKVRLDLYPEPTDKVYSQHYVDKPDELPPNGLTTDELKEWWLTTPKHKELNPCLCHFIKIEPTTTLTELLAYLRGIYDVGTLKTLDDYLVSGNVQIISYIMKDRLGTGKRISEAVDLDTLNTRFASLEVKV